MVDRLDRLARPSRDLLGQLRHAGPVGEQSVSESEDGERVEIELRRPLEEFRLAASNLMGKEFARPEDAYGDTDWRPRRLDMDLTWTTDGVPYHYDLTTRYEIPCLVSGTVTVDGETFDVDGQGQRDHSWGVRDWWAFGWCWCSMRLNDGTRVHLADIRMIPDVPVFFGYIQTPGAVFPSAGLTVTEDLGDHGFPSRADRHRGHPAPAPSRMGRSPGFPSAPCSCATTTAARAGSPGPWCAAAPTTAARDPDGSSGITQIERLARSRKAS